MTYFSLEVYVLLRLAFLILSPITHSGRRTVILRDARAWKALSLLSLELLTIGPAATRLSLLADFIPFSLGALAVLGKLNSVQPKDIQLIR